MKLPKCDWCDDEVRGWAASGSSHPWLSVNIAGWKREDAYVEYKFGFAYFRNGIIASALFQHFQMRRVMKELAGEAQ